MNVAHGYSADAATGVYTRSRPSSDRVTERRGNKQSGRGTRQIPRADIRGRRDMREARIEASRRRRFALKKRALLLALSIIVIFSALVAVVYKALFRISDISADGSTRYSSEEIVAASGISDGMNLYSFRKSSVRESLMLACPYISDIEIDREIPNTVVLHASEDAPVYYTEVYGEIKVLSSGLRVLDSASDAESLDGELIRLRLPAITYSVAGRVITFADSKYERTIREVLSAVDDSELNGRIGAINLQSLYDISMTCDGKYRLEIGDTSRLELKLLTASKVLEDEMFDSDSKMKIDLTVEGKTSVIIDNKLELD